MYKVERKSDGKIIAFDKFVTEYLVDKIKTNYGVDKVRAKELLFESLSMNVVVEEIMYMVEDKIAKDKIND